MRFTTNTLKYTFSKPLATDGSQDGTYVILVTLRDSVGNTSPQTSCSFIYDTLAPQVESALAQVGARARNRLLTQQ